MSTSPIIPLDTVTVSTEVRPATLISRRPPAEEIVAWTLLGALLVFVLLQHLVSAAIVTLALYAIFEGVSKRISRRLSGSTARPLAVLIVTAVSAAVVTGAIALTVTVLRHGATNIPDMMNQMAEILGSVRLWLGGFGHQLIPDVMTDAEDLKATIANWLKTHAQMLRAGGRYIGIGLVHSIMGVLLALLIFFRHATHPDEGQRGPLARHLLDKMDRFGDAFARVATAQIKISALNTTLTGLYLLVALPAFGIQVPFAPTLVLITFVCGLIPVLGNLISNTVITILSMGVSIATAFASLAFLVVIHKLEYLVNSRIVGGETDSQAWEILMAIIIGEAAFGIGGVVMAPIVYAFIKRELRDRGLV
ncbi:MAG TPA: AI-2E family transporter [Thermoanaerobaculia bacterium]|jgi:predicted PurR-regulated permease PerM|nr:AI-2E family transporter [Thermoanaerobaculia bacterium]